MLPAGAPGAHAESEAGARNVPCREAAEAPRAGCSCSCARGAPGLCERKGCARLRWPCPTVLDDPAARADEERPAARDATSTSPSRVTQPFVTVEVMRSSGTNTFHSSASRIARAICASLRLVLPLTSTAMSLATSRTPATRCAAFPAASFLPQLLTVPVSVTTPEVTATPISASFTCVSHLSSSESSSRGAVGKSIGTCSRCENDVPRRPLVRRAHVP